jgi:hypothetical protein
MGIDSDGAGAGLVGTAARRGVDYSGLEDPKVVESAVVVAGTD